MNHSHGKESHTREYRKAMARVSYNRWYGKKPYDTKGFKHANCPNTGIRTQDEVAKLLGVSHQAVTQLERKAVEKVRLCMAPVLYEARLITAKTCVELVRNMFALPDRVRKHLIHNYKGHEKTIQLAYANYCN